MKRVGFSLIEMTVAAALLAVVPIAILRKTGQYVLQLLQREPGQAPEPFASISEYRRVLARDLQELRLSYPENGTEHPFTSSQRGEPACLAFDLRIQNPQTGRISLTHLQTSIKPRNDPSWSATNQKRPDD